MAMFVRLPGDEATGCGIYWCRSPRCGTNRLVMRKNICPFAMPLSIHKARRGAFFLVGESRMLVDPVLSDSPSRHNGWRGYLTGKNAKEGGDR